MGGEMVVWCLLGALCMVAVESSPVPTDNNNNTSVYLFTQQEIVDEIKALKKRMTSNENTIASNNKTIAANHKTIATNHKTIADHEKTISTNKQTISDLKQRLSVYTKQCKLEAHDACGPCVCKEDRRLRKKYYCDCTLLEARKDCLEFHQAGHKVDGIYIVEQLKMKFQVFCDMTTDGGGWTVIQRRNGDPFVNFYRTWDEYKEGFGDLQHEHWLGNEYLHAMSLTGQCLGANDLRVEIEKYDSGQRYYAKYDHFAVNSEYHKYRLSVGKYTGNATDELSQHNAMKFSTYDQDNDIWSDNCAKKYRGAWWYNNCIGTNPNSRYMFDGDKSGDAINNPTPIYWNWYLKFIEMKIRRNKEGNCTQ